jgi:hypothetical protein
MARIFHCRDRMRSQRHTPVAALALLVAWLGACGGEEYETVRRVLEDPQAHDGEIVRLRGFAQLPYSTTLRACEPVTCDCNSVSAQLVLSASTKWTLDMPRVRIDDGDGDGDQCQLDFARLDPSAPAFEFVGRFVAPTGNGEGVLEDVDFAASSSLHGDGTIEELEARPLSTGPHECTCDFGNIDACFGVDSALSCTPAL